MSTHPRFEEWFATYVPMRGAEDPPATTETPAAPEAPAAPDFSAVDKRFDEIGAQMQELMGRIPEPVAPEQEVEQPFDFSTYDTTDPAQAEKALQDYVTRQIEQANKPLLDQLQAVQQQTQAQRQSLDARDLEQRYPELQNPEMAERVIGQAASYAQVIGSPEMATNPGFLELVYLAERAGERADGETPAGGQVEAALESAAGGAAGGAETSVADQIRAGRGKPNSVFGF